MYTHIYTYIPTSMYIGFGLNIFRVTLRNILDKRNQYTFYAIRILKF